MENWINEQNAILLILILSFIFKNKLFVTPEQLAAMRSEILATVKKDYATKELAAVIREDISEIKHQLTTISEYIMHHHSQP